MKKICRAWMCMIISGSLSAMDPEHNTQRGGVLLFNNMPGMTTLYAYHSPNWNIEITRFARDNRYEGSYSCFINLCGKRIATGGRCLSKELTAVEAKKVWDALMLRRACATR